MNAANTLVIERLTVAGFGPFVDEHSWEFGMTTTVTGHNYQGKSTIADAIAFALTGASYFGGRDLDHLQNAEQPCLKVMLKVRLDDQPHDIRRIRLNSKTTLSVDGTKTTQEQFAARFGSKDLILSLLNPLYFAEVLGSDGQKLIESHLPAVSHMAVMQKLSDHMRSVLGEDRLEMPEIYLKKQRDEVKELEKDHLVLDGQMQQTDSTRERLQRDLAEKQSLLAHTTAALLPLQQKCDAQDNSALDSEIAKLSAQYEAAQDTDRDAERHTIHEELSKVRDTRYQSLNAKRLIEMDAYLQRQYALYNYVQGSLAELQQQGVCPTCLRRIDENSLPEIQEAFAAQLVQIKSDGTAVRQQHETLAAQEAQQERQFATWRGGEIARLEQALQDATQMNSAEQQRQITKAKIKELSAQRALCGLTSEESERYHKLFRDQGKLESEVEQITKMIDSLPKNQKEALAEIDKKILVANNKIAAAKAYMSERTALLFAPVQMSKAGLQLYEAIKESGELRDVFKLTYEGRDYVQLSLSERVRCGLEIVELLSRLTGKSYPLFIDNAESFCNLGIANLCCQRIVVRVVAGQPLTVRNLDIPQQKAG